MTHKEITLDERKEIQLKMLDEIHEFCVSHNIKYSLAYGTLLGAIRHKGFIPWDDDVDIMMPFQDMIRLKRELKSENIKYCDVDTEEHFCYPFSRIAYRPTYQRLGRNGRTYGVNIDLYPIISLPQSAKEREAYFKRGKYFIEIRLFFMRLRKLFSKLFGVKNIPGHDWAIRLYRDHILQINNNKVESEPITYYVVAGPIEKRDQHTYHLNMFANTELAQFEDRKYMITSDYDTFLKVRYGDYMQLPPESERHPYHGGHYFWSE